MGGRRPSRAQQLYRCYDANGRLLYLGVSLNAVSRAAQHRAGSAWFASVARIDIETLQCSRTEIELRERTAIKREKPLHNIKGTERERSWQPPAPERHWEVEPLVRRVCLPGIQDLARVLRIDRAELSGPLTDQRAGELCQRLQVHPRSVWPEWDEVA